MAFRNRARLCRSLAVTVLAGLASSTAALATHSPIRANQAPSVRDVGAKQTYELALAWISALAVVEEVRLKLAEGKDLTETLVANRLARNKLQMVRIAFIPFEAAFPKALTDQEADVRREFEQFTALFESDIDDSFRLMKKATTLTTEKEVNQLSVELAESVGRTDLLWRRLPLMAAELSHALTDSQRLVEGRIAFVRIDRDQKAALQKRLLEAFPDASATPKGGFATRVSASLLYSFLAQPWRTSDDR